MEAGSAPEHPQEGDRYYQPHAHTDPCAHVTTEANNSVLFLPRQPIRFKNISKQTGLQLTLNEEKREDTDPTPAVKVSVRDRNLQLSFTGSCQQRISPRTGFSLSLSRSCLCGDAGPVATTTLLSLDDTCSSSNVVVGDLTSFVTDRCVPSPSSQMFTVQLHVYDLTRKLKKPYTEVLLGRALSGLYHSGIVCYGMEFYFEGGISMAGAGHTRFGKKFEVIELGRTRKRLPEFLCWLREVEATCFQLHHYHPLEHNCNHFSRRATKYLLESDERFPLHLFSTVDEMMETEVGSACASAFLLTAFGAQHAMAKYLCSCVAERQSGLYMARNSSIACGVFRLPPLAVVLYRVEDPALCKESLMSISPYILRLIEQCILKESALLHLDRLSSDLTHGYDTLDPGLVLAYVEVVMQAFLHSPLLHWGPLFNSLRLAVLHKAVLTAVVFHPQMLLAIKLASRDFPSLSADGKLGLLRLLCNLSCSSHGAIVLNAPIHRNAWVAVAGMGLMDSNLSIVCTAATLVHNMAIAVTVATSSSLKRELHEQYEEHTLVRLAIVISYNLSNRTVDQLPDAAMRMLLSGLLFLSSSSTLALGCISSHSFPLNYPTMLSRAQSKECRALLCILKALNDTYDI